MEALAGEAVALTVLLIAIAILVTIRIQWFRNKRLRKRIEELEEGWRLGESRRIERDRSLITSAEKEVWLLGINSLGPLHEAREALVELLKSGGAVQVLLLDPTSQAFRKREGLEEKNDGHQPMGRLRAEFEASVAICRDIAAFGGDQRKIEVKVHEKEPTFALVVVDSGTGKGRLHYNIYPEGPHLRGYSGPHKAVPNDGPWKDQFALWVERYKDLWGGATKVDLRESQELGSVPE